jgi:DNA-binding MarR family transcriptional regulator
MSIQNLTPNKALRLVQAILRDLREVDPWMGLQTAECFLVIAARPGITMQELCEETGLAQSSASRNVALLSKWHRLGKPGADWVTNNPDPAERRRKVMHLTDKGISKVRSILSRIDPELKFDAPTAKSALKGYI